LTPETVVIGDDLFRLIRVERIVGTGGASVNTGRSEGDFERIGLARVWSTIPPPVSELGVRIRPSESGCALHRSILGTGSSRWKLKPDEIGDNFSSVVKSKVAPGIMIGFAPTQHKGIAS